MLESKKCWQCVVFLLFYRRNFGRGVGKKYSPRLSLDRDDAFHGVPFEGDGRTPFRHAPGLRGLVGNGPETGSLSRFTILTSQQMSMFCTQLFAHRIHKNILFSDIRAEHMAYVIWCWLQRNDNLKSVLAIKDTLQVVIPLVGRPTKVGEPYGR